MRDELLITRNDMLCLGMGNTPFKAVYVELHYLVGVQNPVKYIFKKPVLTGQIACDAILPPKGIGQKTPRGLGQSY